MFSEQRIEYLIHLSKTPDIYERLAHALGTSIFVLVYHTFTAPSIYENDNIKKGILLQLFGGTKKDFKNTGRGHFR